MAIDEITIATPPSQLFQGITSNYLDNLTYSEFLLGILKKMNEVIEASNAQQEFIDKFEKEYEYLLAQFELLRSQFNSLADEINESVTKQLEDFQESVNNQINLLQNYLIAYSDANDQYLQDQIDSIQVGAINVIDPTTGILSPIQTVINNIAGSNSNSLTATEYDALDLTATSYDGEEITAYDYDFNGKAILV